MNKIIRTIVRLPFLPFMIIYAIYVIYKIYKETGIIEMEIRHSNGEGILTEEIKEHIKDQIIKYGVHINVISMILWFMIYMWI